MALYLIQHGKSLSKDQDPDQGLSAEGIAETERIARIAKDEGVAVSQIRHSVKTRARQTAEIVMLVGHLPFMERLASFLIMGSIDKPVFKFQNSGIVCLDKDPEAQAWIIQWALMPKIG